MFKSFILALVITMNFVTVGRAQQKEQKFFGIIKDSVTLIPIPNVSVNNKSANHSTYTSESGLFQILAHVGDTIYYYAPSFINGYYVVNNQKIQMDTVEIWLRPKIKEELPGVFVSTYVYKDYQKDSAARMAEFIQDVGMKTPTFSKSNSGAGLGIGLDALFSKKNKQKKRALEVFKEDERERYIDFRFKSVLVNHYSGLKGTKLQEFMHKYRPTYVWLRENPDDEALKYYINDRLKLYFQRYK